MWLGFNSNFVAFMTVGGLLLPSIISKADIDCQELFQGSYKI